MAELILTVAILAGVALLARVWVLVGRDDNELFGSEGVDKSRRQK